MSEPDAKLFNSHYKLETSLGLTASSNKLHEIYSVCAVEHIYLNPQKKTYILKTTTLILERGGVYPRPTR